MTTAETACHSDGEGIKSNGGVVAAGALTVALAEALTAMSNGGGSKRDSDGGGRNGDSQQR